MADQKKRISELPLVGSTDGLMTLGVNAQNESVKVPLGELLESYNNAVTEASQAKTAATNATNAANQAKTAADAAQEAAEAAQTAAENAEDAIDDIQQIASQAKTAANNAGLAFFDGIVQLGNITQASATSAGDVVYLANKHLFALRVGTTYYGNWEGADAYLNSTHSAILKNKVYSFGKNLYVWDETTSNLVMAGTDPTAMDNAIADAIKSLTFINASVLFNLTSATTLSAVTTLLNTSDVPNKAQGLVVTFLGSDGWETWQWSGSGGITQTSLWRKFGGSASVGNCYNVTNDAPISGYYTLDTAIAVAFAKGYTSVGIQITFSIGQTTWKTYQYIGADSTETNFKNSDNWLDLAGMSAGDEVVMNVDEMCGPCATADYYTLAYAIAAIRSLENATGISYAKPGLIITYKTGEREWETKQFKGAESDFAETGLWSDFGGAGSAVVETSDEPKKDGEDAFSTGGAHKYIPTQINVDTETEGVVKLSLANEDGEAIGEEKQFAVGTGSGESSGTIISISPEQSPLYAQAGGTVILKAAIQSVTTVGGKEQTNLIEKVELYDRSTNTLLETFRLNQASSADAETYDFSFDLSSYFTQASARKFRFVAYDDGDHTGSRNINVTAVDVTIKSEQTLNYTATTALQVGGATKTLQMYKFPNNASEQGILCTTEIYLNGKWQTLGTATISDTYSHSITVNPQSCLGVALAHGAYPIRIHGVDVASGVVGNYLHTAIMAVEQGNTTPIVATRWYSETETASLKQYETIEMDFAVYASGATSVEAGVYESINVGSTIGTPTLKQTTAASRQSTYTYTQRVGGVATDGSTTINLFVKVTEPTAVSSQTAVFGVNGTLLDIESVSTQLMFDIDLSGRSNSDADKSITDNGYTLAVTGSNYSTNGFVKDSFGTEQYGTEADTGLMALRIAEMVTASLNYQPFNTASIETNGLALQMRVKVKHIAYDDARLMSCISGGFGFYLTGKNMVFTTDDAATVAHTITAALPEDTVVDIAIVIEPISQAPYTGIGVVKMYFDGELIGACYYDRNTLTRHATPITFDGSEADLYLYGIRAWETYYGYEQAFDNYLLKMADTSGMIEEYNFNQVMASQAAEGKSATNRPQASALAAIGIPYFVLCKSTQTEDSSDNYPDYLETLDGDKKTKRYYDVYAYFPDRPWQDFKAEKVPTTNQGTTSSMRPIKNIKMKFKGCTVTLLHDRSEFTGDELTQYDECAANAAKSKVQPTATSIPTNIITVKVDYSESGGANNGASCQLFNELQRALGASYMTPAQNAYTGGYILNTSIDSIPCAFFRTDANSPDATSPSHGYFHAKGNWNYDKGDPAVFGFEKVEGYNADCLNYGDFIELIAERDQSLDDYEATLDKTAWMPVDNDGNENIYVLSEFCGPNHKVFRYRDGAWVNTTGTMTYSGGRWRITGDVVNPVENYELKAYNDFDWFQNVDSIDDLLEPQSATDSTPKWLAQFESRYPDNDDLNAAYADGRKVPYRLYQWLRWCQDCNQNLTESHGNITIDGVEVSGTKANRLKKFKRELHKVANVHSMICYHVFTDYIAAVDQRSKNLMVGFYLDTDGVVRMYLNHLYDGDTILGSDNDCGLTIPALLDPNNDPNGYYQGHDSVLFTQLANADYIWLQDYTSDSDTSDSTKTTTVATVAKAMREVALASGLRPFSPQGIEKYWITDRLSKWPKVVSSHDGLRKYIEHSTSASNYFFALHGLSIQRLRDFVATRFLFRDGFYQCGDTYSSAAAMRCTGTNMSVTITAAKAGFFGMGVDRANEANGGSCYLEEGETHTFYSNNTNTGSGVMLYLFGADRIGELDLTKATPKQQGWDISELTLLKKLTLGGASYSPATNTGDELATLNLGQLPFLEELDARNFPLTSIDASYCPRLKTVLATGSNLQKFTPAETSPLTTLTLPATMTDLVLVNLPNLTYPDGGLQVAGFSKVQRLQLQGCAGIDHAALMKEVVDASSVLTAIAVDELNETDSADLLTKLMQMGVKGIDSALDEGCDGLTGQWVMNALIPDADLAALQAYFNHPTSLKIYNCQFTTVVFDDTVDAPQNITNLENGTTGDAYSAANSHMVRIRAKLIPVVGKLNTDTGVWEGVRLSDESYRKYADGTDWEDYTDSLGSGVDVFMRCPAFWYKGINDFKNQKKYICWSSLTDEPLSTATKVNRATLATLLHTASATLIVTAATAGESTLATEGVVTSASGYNLYSIDVEGMKQVRWPGMNHASIGGAFLDANGVIIKTFNMAVVHTLFDFMEGEDYVFCDVPDGAKTFVFTSKATNSAMEAIAVNSSNIEAIEPDWVHNAPWLGGVYHASVDSLLNLRSISGATVRVGTGTSTTSSEWTYDSEGRVTNIPLNGMNYTGKDFMNLAMRRGQGFQLFDYEMSKLMAILWMSLNGTRDSQLVCGYGRSSGGTTGSQDLVGNHDTARATASNGNKCLGFENFFGCTWEWMDNIGVNITSFAAWLKDACTDSLSTYPIDAKYHIYDPLTKTERVVQGQTASGYCIGRVKHGRYCDVIASKCTSDNSTWAKNYCDANYYTASRGRAVGRSHSNSYANGGVADAYAYFASSSSITNGGSRLAFRGDIQITNE